MNCSKPGRSSNCALWPIFALLALADAVEPLQAATLFVTRTAFESALSDRITDDYEASGYQVGDLSHDYDIDRHTDISMSAVLGETSYVSTGRPNFNFVVLNRGNRYYCAGCDGSYSTDFTKTSVGSSNGVYGVGFDIVGREELLGTHAFVTFGDNGVSDFALPQVDAFWGITSQLLIKNIHFGLENGGTNNENKVQRMAMDNLTIGAAIPEPGVITLVLVQLIDLIMLWPRTISSRAAVYPYLKRC